MMDKLLKEKKVKKPLTFEIGCSDRHYCWITRDSNSNNTVHFTPSVLSEPIIYRLDFPRPAHESLGSFPVLFFYSVEVLQVRA